MLGKATRKRISSKKMLDQKNPSQDLKRIRAKCNLAIRDLTLVAKKLDEKQLQEIFTSNKLAPLILAILEPKNKRTMNIAEMLAGRVFNKLASELPPVIVNELGSDIGKTWTYAKMASEYWDKSLMTPPKKRKSKSKP